MDNLISIHENGIHFSVILSDEQEAEMNRLMQEGMPETEALDKAQEYLETTERDYSNNQ